MNLEEVNNTINLIKADLHISGLEIKLKPDNAYWDLVFKYAY